MVGSSLLGCRRPRCVSECSTVFAAGEIPMCGSLARLCCKERLESFETDPGKLRGSGGTCAGVVSFFDHYQC